MREEMLRTVPDGRITAGQQFVGYDVCVIDAVGRVNGAIARFFYSEMMAREYANILNTYRSDDQRDGDNYCQFVVIPGFVVGQTPPDLSSVKGAT